jgi:hypothetical protein
MYCKNLPILDLMTKSSDPYVEIEVLPKTLFKDLQSVKTNIIYTNLNPVFNETFSL